MGQDTCEFEHEGFCILQCEYPEAKKCPKAKGYLPMCTATEDDLAYLCPDCGHPEDECICVWD